jgi:methionyl-tRNA formyltransferase
LRLDGRYPDEARQARSLLQAAAPDVIVVAAYGLILPLWVLELPIYGCINIHASLLPRWRGAAPIQRAIEAGDVCTGITIMQMDAGLDTGNILLTHEVPIGVNQTAGELHVDLAAVGASAIVRALQELAAGTLSGVPQPTENVTYAAKLSKACATLNVSVAAEVLARQVRAFNPVPGATILLPGLDSPVKLWRAQALAECHTATPGTVLRVTPAGIDVATGEGVLRLLELQKAGGKRQPVAAFVRGWHGS